MATWNDQTGAQKCTISFLLIDDNYFFLIDDTFKLIIDQFGTCWDDQVEH